MSSHTREVEFWLEYIRLLRFVVTVLHLLNTDLKGEQFGQNVMNFFLTFRQVNDSNGCRKVFTRAIQTSNDNPELLCELYLKFEKEEGGYFDSGKGGDDGGGDDGDGGCDYDYDDVGGDGVLVVMV